MTGRARAMPSAKDLNENMCKALHFDTKRARRYREQTVHTAGNVGVLGMFFWVLSAHGVDVEKPPNEPNYGYVPILARYCGSCWEKNA